MRLIRYISTVDGGRGLYAVDPYRVCLPDGTDPPIKHSRDETYIKGIANDIAHAGQRTPVELRCFLVDRDGKQCFVLRQPFGNTQTLACRMADLPVHAVFVRGNDMVRVVGGEKGYALDLVGEWSDGTVYFEPTPVIDGVQIWADQFEESEIEHLNNNKDYLQVMANAVPAGFGCRARLAVG